MNLMKIDAQVVATIHGKDITRKEMTDAFNRVANTDNWKAPINKTLHFADFETCLWEMVVIRESIIFFTGSVPEFRKTSRENYINIRADGYYKAAGA